MKKEFKSGFVSILGRTNVGKSTIINALVGQKIAAVADKVQTTRTAIKGIITNENAQIIIIDTPGIHKPKTKLGETMIDTAFGTADDVDIILFVIDATSTQIGKGDSRILEKIKKQNKKTILVINKIDALKNKEDLLHLIDLYQKEYNFISTVPVSAIKKDNIEVLLEEIEKNLSNGPAYYDKEEYTDQTLRQLVEEVIREKALKFLNEEVPHGIFVETEKMKLRKTKEKDQIYDVEATIYTLKNSHKGIIIGKDGAMIKRIGTSARKTLEKMLGIKINLKLWVKVKEDWQNSDSIIKKFKQK